MRPKGIKPFEQHVEKIVLGVVSAIFLVVLITQLTSPPLEVEIAGVVDEPLDVLEGAIANKALDAKRQMELGQSELAEGSEEGLPSVEGAVASLGSRWRSAISPIGPMELASLVDPSGPGAGAVGQGAVSAGVTGQVRYREVEVPAPERVLTAVHRATLDPFAVIEHQGLASLVPETQPFDKASVTVEAVFDGRELASMLAADPDGQGTEFASLPREWWEDNVAVFGLEVERADGLDAEGRPINPVVLGGLPGRESPLDPIGETAVPSASAYQARISRAISLSDQIVRPAYYSTVAGPQWRSPSDQAALERIESRRDEIDRLLRRLESTSSDIERIEGELASVGAGSTAAEQQAADRRRERLDRDLDAALDREQRLIRELEEIGVNEEGTPLLLAEDEDERDRDAARRAASGSVLDDPEYNLWWHDLTVEPGSQYIYRARVVLSNPFYGYGSELSSEQADLARQVELVGEWSRWSEPMRILPDETFFVTSASVGGTGGASTPRASAEAFRFYYGYWRSTLVSLEPGQTIRGEISLPDPKLLPIFDLEALGAGLSGGPVRRGGRVDERDRGRGGAVGRSRGADRRPIGGDRRAGTDDEEVELPPNATPGPERIPVAIDTMLLDVAEIVEGIEPAGSSRFQAYFQDVGGKIVVRRPGVESSSGQYRRLAESAAQGQRQGLPEPEPEPEPVIEAPIPEPVERRDEYAPGRGRGGGGGGGG